MYSLQSPNLTCLDFLLQYCPAFMPFCAGGGWKGHDIIVFSLLHAKFK